MTKVGSLVYKYKDLDVNKGLTLQIGTNKIVEKTFKIILTIKEINICRYNKFTYVVVNYTNKAQGWLSTGI